MYAAVPDFFTQEQCQAWKEGLWLQDICDHQFIGSFTFQTINESFPFRLCEGTSSSPPFPIYLNCYNKCKLEYKTNPMIRCLNLE